MQPLRFSISPAVSSELRGGASNCNWPGSARLTGIDELASWLPSVQATDIPSPQINNNPISSFQNFVS